MANEYLTSDNCIFCRIANGQDESTELCFQDDELAVFADHRPASRRHYLVVPRGHVANTKALTPEHLHLLDRMVTVGRQVLSSVEKEAASPTEEDTLMGFHRPPFNTVAHLHLHVIWPTSAMSFLSRIIFRPGWPWFQTAAALREALQPTTTA